MRSEKNAKLCLKLKKPKNKEKGKISVLELNCFLCAGSTVTYN